MIWGASPGAIPPDDLPDVTTPAPDFLTAGKGLAKGAEEGGFWKGLGDVLGDVFNKVIASAIAILMFNMIRIVGFFAKRMVQGQEVYRAELAELGASSLSHLLGTPVAPPAMASRTARDSRTAISKEMGAKVMEALMGSASTATGGTLTPSSEAAERYVYLMTHMAVEGWMESWLADSMSFHLLERVGDLKDVLERVLGLGRMTRRVLAPVLSTLVETPFQWKLNQIYRPAMLSFSEAIRQYLRGRYTRERLFREGALAGLKDEDIEAVLTTHQKFLGDSDVRLLLDRKVWTEEQGIQHLRDAGWSEALAKTTLQLEEERRVDVYRRKTVDAAVDAFEKRDIEEPQLREMLQTVFLPEWEDFWIRKVAGARRVMNVRHLTTSEVEQAVKRGILSLNDFRAHCERVGYLPADVRTLELLLMTEIADKQAAEKAKAELAAARAQERAAKAQEQAARRAEIEAELAVREVSLAQMEAMVRRGLRSIEQYREFLTALKYAPADVSGLAELLEGQIDDARAAAERRAELEAEARKRKISLSDLERAVKLRLMSVDEYRSQLAAAGFGDEDRQLLAMMLQRELDLAAENEARKAEAAARLAERHISLEDLERAVRLGRRTVDQYRARLAQEGFRAEDADLLADLLRADIKADQEARDRRAEIEARLKRKKISLSDMEQAVRAGVRTMSDYRNVLLREGYSDEDTELLARLLQLRVDADTQAKATHQEAEAKLAERRISLSDVERAVKLGVMDLAAYRRVLTREGFTAEDQGILVEMLTAELAAIRAAEKKRAEAEKAAAKRQISLSDLERAVRVGVRSAVEYQGALQALGYSARDQATLMALLQLQMAQDQAARLRQQQVAAEVATRGLSLAQWERAVLEGLRTLAEYRAWLREQGYGEEDAATLVALLQLQLAEQAARQKGKTA